MGESFDANQAEGFVAEHWEEHPLASLIPGIEVARGDFAEEPDPRLELEGGHLSFESGAVPAIAGDDELPGDILEKVEGIESDLNALRGNEAGREEEEAGLLGIGEGGGGGWGVELDEIDPGGIITVFEEAGLHEARGDLDAEVGMVADMGEAIGAGPAACIAEWGASATTLEVMPEETGQSVRAMAGGEVSGHAIAAGTEPGLVVEKGGGREGGGFIDECRLTDAVDLDDIGLPLETEGGEIAWVATIGEGADGAIDGDRAGILVGEEDLMTGVLKEPAGFDDNPVSAPVVRASCFVDQDDAHGRRVPRTGGLEKNLKPGYLPRVIAGTGSETTGNRSSQRHTMRLPSILSTLILILTVPLLKGATEERIERRFEVRAGGQVTIEVDFGAIEVVAHDRGEVAVEVWRQVNLGSERKEKEFLAERPVSIEKVGDEVTVKVTRSLNPGMGWSWRGNRRQALYKIAVPVQTRLNLLTSGGHVEVKGVGADVEARTSGGSIRFQQLTGTLEGKTSGGRIEVLECRGKTVVETSGGSIEIRGGGGDLEAETSGGAIRVGPYGGPVRVSTSGGGITVENVAGEVRGTTSGGSIRAILTAPVVGPVRLETSGGSIAVTAPESAAFDLDASTSGGGVQSELPVTTTGKTRRGELVGSVNGGGERVKLRTSGGSVRVRKAAPAAMD